MYQFKRDNKDQQVQLHNKFLQENEYLRDIIMIIKFLMKIINSDYEYEYYPGLNQKVKIKDNFHKFKSICQFELLV